MRRHSKFGRAIGTFLEGKLEMWRKYGLKQVLDFMNPEDKAK